MINDNYTLYSRRIKIIYSHYFGPQSERAEAPQCNHFLNIFTALTFFFVGHIWISCVFFISGNESLTRPTLITFLGLGRGHPFLVEQRVLTARHKLPTCLIWWSSLRLLLCIICPGRHQRGSTLCQWYICMRLPFEKMTRVFSDQINKLIIN